MVYNVKSPTVNLDKVFFPSVTICNMNILRRSFILSLLNETNLWPKVNYLQLQKLIEVVFLSGGNKELSIDEQNIIDSKTIDLIMPIKVLYVNLFNF